VRIRRVERRVVRIREMHVPVDGAGDHVQAPGIDRSLPTQTVADGADPLAGYPDVGGERVLWGDELAPPDDQIVGHARPFGRPAPLQSPESPASRAPRSTRDSAGQRRCTVIGLVASMSRRTMAG